MKNRSEVSVKVKEAFLKKGGAILKEADVEVLKEEIESRSLLDALAYHVDRWRDLTRPALMVLACEAVGGESKNTFPLAEALILLSGAIDIHDDIIDESKARKSKPTLLGKFGRDVALLASDILSLKGFCLIFRLLEQNILPETILKVVQTLRDLLLELADAEALELEFRGRWDVVPAEYLKVVKKKAADVEAYMRLGAILGGGSDEEIEILGEYGRMLGAMAILRDDLEDMLDFDVEMISRIRKEALPLPVLYAIENPETSKRIAVIAKKKEINADDAEAIFDLVEQSGGLQMLGHTIRDLRDRGTDCLMLLQRKREILRQILEATVPPV